MAHIMQRWVFRSGNFSRLFSTDLHTSTQKRMASELPTEEVLSGCQSELRTLTLNRPAALNALNIGMIRKIVLSLRQWDLARNCRVIIVKSTGNAFCAGGDVKNIALRVRENKNDSEARNFFKEEYEMNHLIATLRTPYIAIMDGITMGGGVGLSAHGKYRIATENTVLAMPEAGIGFFPDVGGSFFLPRLDGALGTFLALTGYQLKGQDVFHAGLGTHYIPSCRLPALEIALSSLSMPDTFSIARLLDDHSGDLQDFSLSPHREMIDRCFNQPTVESIMKSLEEEGSSFSAGLLASMKRMCPMSLKTALRAIHLGKTKSLRECLLMEYKCAENLIKRPDFYEGVRATLIDKDKNPKWQPATLEEISQENVNAIFLKTGKFLVDFFVDEDIMEYRNSGAIPGEEKILAFVVPGKSTLESVLKAATVSISHSGGARMVASLLQIGYVGKIREIIQRKCNTLPDGTLVWKEDSANTAQK